MKYSNSLLSPLSPPLLSSSVLFYSLLFFSFSTFPTTFPSQNAFHQTRKSEHRIRENGENTSKRKKKKGHRPKTVLGNEREYVLECVYVLLCVVICASAQVGEEGKKCRYGRRKKRSVPHHTRLQHPAHHTPATQQARSTRGTNMKLRSCKQREIERRKT
jgi:hypothetical protein